MRPHGLLAEPSKCDNCGSNNIELQYDIRGGRNKWRCQFCNASVGCHECSRSPLGRMALSPVRALRVNVHAVFDQIWDYKKGCMGRNDAYTWLAAKLGIPLIEAHIALLSEDQLRVALRECKYFLNSKAFAQLYKIKKKNGKRKRQCESSGHRRTSNGGSSKQRSIAELRNQDQSED